MHEPEQRRRLSPPAAQAAPPASPRPFPQPDPSPQSPSSVTSLCRVLACKVAAAPFVPRRVIGQKRIDQNLGRARLDAKCGISYFDGSEIRHVNTLSGLNPGLTARRRSKLFTNKPAPASNTSASAISQTTRRSPTRRLGAPELPPWLPAFSASLRSFWKHRRAGTNPKARPVKTDNPIVKRRT